MAGDFNKPTVNSTYTNYPVEIRDMFADQSKMFDGTTTTNYPTNAIRWSSTNGRFEKYNGSVWNALITKYLIDVDTVDGYHAGNGNGNVAVSNGTVCTNLSADMVDGYNAGNSSGQVPISNGTVCTNLNADLLDGYNTGNGSGAIPISNGTVCTNLNADMLDGYHAASFALLAGASFTGNVSVAGTGSISLSTSGDITCYRSGGTTGVIYFGNSGARYLYYNGSTYIMPGAPLDVGGTVYATAFQVSSLRELKQDIQPMQDTAIAEVMQWKMYDYAYRDKPDEKVRGWMADEMIDTPHGDGEHVNVSSIVATLAKAFQEYVRSHP